MSCQFVGCRKKIKANSLAVDCVDCNGKFHASCVNITQQEIEFLSQENKFWRCAECQTVRRKSMALQSAADGGSVSIADVVAILNEMREDNKKMEKSLGNSIEASHEKIDEVMQKMIEQDKLLQDCYKKMENYETEIVDLKRRNVELESRLTDAEQYSRINNVEIHGIPQTGNENVSEIVQNVGKALDVPISEVDIDVCHRLGKTTDRRSPAIIVRFVRRVVKDELLRRRKIKRDFSTRHLNLPSDVPIYINEALCPARRRVFAAAREAKKTLGYKYLWIKGGKILIRKSDGTSVTELKTVNDVNNLK